MATYEWGLAAARGFVAGVFAGSLYAALVLLIQLHTQPFPPLTVVGRALVLSALFTAVLGAFVGVLLDIAGELQGRIVTVPERVVAGALVCATGLWSVLWLNGEVEDFATVGALFPYILSYAAVTGTAIGMLLRLSSEIAKAAPN